MFEADAGVNSAEEAQQPYRAPKIVAIGRAVDLLQGSTGKHYDGSSGYYWNEEG